MIIFMLFFLIINSINCQLFWEQLFDTLSYKNYNKPPPRRDSAIAYDRDRNRIILFGGCQTKYLNDYYPIVFDDTWEFNLDTKLWKELTLSVLRPNARHGMVYSHNKYGLYISSGRGSYTQFFNDIWVFDFSTDMWKKMDQSGYRIPSERYDAVGGLYPSYETTDSRMNNFYLLHGQALDEMFGNLYRYTFTDLRNLNGVWGEAFHDAVGPYGADYPHARYGHSATLIAPDTLLMFGGCLSSKYTGGPCPSSDSWLFVKNKWERVDSSCISPRIHSSMASLVSDGNKFSAILFSGLEKDRTVFKTDEEYDNEVSLYDHVYKTWIRKRVQGFYFPEKRNGHVMCTGRYNNDYGVYMFGGYGHSSETNLADLWFLKANITEAFNAPTINQCARVFTSIHLHSILMFIGWAVFINIGILLARYTNKKIWKKVHRVTQIIALLLITSGLFFGIWSAHGRPHLAHTLIGSAAYLLALFQPMSAYLRYSSQNIDYYLDEDEKIRAENSFNKKFRNKYLPLSHQYSGHISNLLALINISMGIFYSTYHWMWYIIWFTYLGILLITYSIFEYKKRFLNKKKSSSDNDNRNEICLKDTNRSINKKVLKDDQTDLSDDSGIKSARSTSQRYTDNKNIKQSPTTPPPPYYSRNSEQSPPMNTQTLPKQSKLLEYSQNISHVNAAAITTSSSIKKNNKQSYSKQFLIENITSDDDQYYNDQYENRDVINTKTSSSSNKVVNKNLQYSPKFKTSYESNTKY